MGNSCQNCNQCLETSGIVPNRLSQAAKNEIHQIAGLQLMRSEYNVGNEEGEIEVAPTNYDENGEICNITHMSYLPHEPNEETCE